MMEEKESKDGGIILSSPGNSPFRFRIIIKQSFANKEQCTFEVTATDLQKKCIYVIPDRKHSSYLTLFEKLSKDFGLRLPQNRQSQIKNFFAIPYRELLTENLVPEMLYGYGDPAVLRVDENETWYYLVATSNDAPDSFPICRSKNLTDWEFVNFIFPKGNKPQWAADGLYISDYWAPEMHKVSGEFRVYFVAREKDTLELCIGMARSSSPEGPFIADAEPILKRNKIDPHVFVEDDGTAFLYWKEDNNATWPNLIIDLLHKDPSLIKILFAEKNDQLTASFIITLLPWIQALNTMEAFLVQQILIEAVTAEFSSFKERLIGLPGSHLPDLQKDILDIIDAMRTPVYAQKLSANGSGLVGEPKFIIENDQPWEAHLIEGMWVTNHNDKFYLFYSGNDFSTDHYGIGVAIGDSPLGPFKKLPEPILRSTEKWRAPGHSSVAMGPDDKHQLFLHAFFPGKAGYKEFRALLSIPVKFEDEKVVLE